MPTVNVKAAPGRIARSAPRGMIIPHDRFVTIMQTPYVLARVRDGDLLVEPKPAPEPVVLPETIPEPAPVEVVETFEVVREEPLADDELPRFRRRPISQD